MEHAIVPPMGEPRRRATYDDLIAVPEHLIAEIIDGELITSPRPAPPHALACSGISSVLFDRFNGPPGGGGAAPGGWWILFEPELHFGDDVLVPDLAGWRRDRMPTLPDIAYFTLAPDWVCEVISPGSGRLDRIRKMPIYARERVRHLWLVDPIARTVEVYRLDGDRWVVEPPPASDAPERITPFAAVEVDPRRWWRGRGADEEAPGPPNRSTPP
jgi:Uma2 family endonuclease